MSPVVDSGLRLVQPTVQQKHSDMKFSAEMQAIVVVVCVGECYLVLVALHFLLQEGLPGHLLQLFSQILTRLHVGLGDILGQMLCNRQQTGQRQRLSHAPKHTHILCSTCLRHTA